MDPAEKTETSPEGAPAQDTQKPAETPDTAKQLGELQTQLAQERENAQAARRDAEGAKAYAAQIAQTLQDAAARSVAQPRNGEPAPDVREQFEQDPVRVLDEHFRTRIAPLAQFSLENQAGMNRQLALGELRKESWAQDLDDKEWRAREREVDEFMANIPPEVKAQPGAWDAAMKFARVNHYDDDVQRRVRKIVEDEKRTFTEGATAAPTAGGKPAPVLNDIERKLAKEFGLTEEQWVTYRTEHGAGA